mgnify:CR=1 FL=1
MNFEIRIFANPSGFAEMSPKMPEQYYSLFSNDIVARRNFDGDRGQLPNGSFSVYYTPDAYIIAYHFSLSSDAQFRGKEVHIAVAVKRDYKMLKPSDTFLQLAKEFERIAVEHKSSAEDIIYNNSEKFYNIVSPKIVKDPQQFKFNTACSVANRAIVAAESKEDRDLILSDPFRRELRDYGILFIINREDGSKVSQLINSGRYTAILDFKFQDARTYTLVYPDGHRVEFTDLNQELPEHTIYRQYEKPLTFSGSVGSNWGNWKISFSEDKTEYIIGLQPEKERRVYNVIAFDQNSRVPLDPSLISVSVGKFCKGQWTLEGEEITKFNNKDVFSINGYSIISITPKEDSTLLQIIACKINTFDPSELFNVLTAYNVPNPTVTLHNSYTKQHQSISMDNDKHVTLLYPYSYYYVEVPETVTTEKATLELDNSGKVKTSSLRKKKTGGITVSNFPDEIKRKLDRFANVGKIKYAYYVKGHTKPTIKDKILNSYPVVISNLPLCLVRIEIMVDGYNVFKDEIDLTINPNQNVVCNLKPTDTTRLKQYCKRYLPTFFIGLILGVFIGFWIANRLSISASQEESDKISALSAEIDSLRRKNNDLHIENNDLKYKLEKEGTNGTPPEGTVLAGTSGAINTSTEVTEQNKLIRQLEGEMFTSTHITRAKQILNGQEELIKDAEACLKILNLDLSKKEELSDPKSDTYKSTVNKLSIHKEIMYEIIEDEVFLACSKNDFISINDWREYKQDKYY